MAKVAADLELDDWDFYLDIVRFLQLGLADHISIFIRNNYFL